jgi:uncharacterized protein (TIGR02001 family)
MMSRIKKSMRFAAPVATAATALLLAGAALADGPAGGSLKDPPKAEEGRKFTWSWNIGATSDYIFRGVSQNSRKPAMQGGVDVTYGILYAGIWSSDVNFGSNAPLGGIGSVANVEVDLYAGIKPVLGPVTFDLGFIHYGYLGGHDRGPRFSQVREQDYQELKLGASATFVPKLTTSITAFLSPQYTGGQGFTTTLEGTVAYELPETLRMTPTISGTVGTVMGDAKDSKDFFTQGNGKDSYLYYNAGLTLGIDKLSLDFRYWGTDIPNINTTIGTPGLGTTGFCTAKLFGCDERFVATAKVTF